MKYNPFLPNMSKLLKKHLHILEIHPNTKKLFCDGNLFVSYKIEPNLKDILTSSRFKEESITTEESEEATSDSAQIEGEGCKGCKDCVMCRDFLKDSKTITGYNTNRQYKIKGTITCNSTYVIYVIRDTVCHLDYVGFTKDPKSRWSNHKSHIKQNIKSCELSMHINFKCPEKHPLTRDSQAAYDKSLKGQLELLLIEEVTIDPMWDDEKITKTMEAREHAWQCQLKATHKFGGLCKRSSSNSKNKAKSKNKV